MRHLFFVIAVAALCASASVLAQTSGNLRYKWHDARGQVHYSDSLSTEAMKYGYDLVNDQGLAVRRVPRQLNADERADARKFAAQQAAQQRVLDEKARADAQMLNAYPDEASFTAAQQLQLNTIDQQLASTRSNLRSQEKTLADLLERAAELERAKQPVPKFLVDSIAQQRNVVAAQRATMDRQHQVRRNAQQESAQQLQHYRQLKAAQATAAG